MYQDKLAEDVEIPHHGQFIATCFVLLPLPTKKKLPLNKNKNYKHLFFNVSKQKLSHSHNSRIRGRDDSYCSISRECQESGYENFKSYKADVNVDI